MTFSEVGDNFLDLRLARVGTFERTIHRKFERQRLEIAFFMRIETKLKMSRQNAVNARGMWNPKPDCQFLPGARNCA